MQSRPGFSIFNIKDDTDLIWSKRPHGDQTTLWKLKAEVESTAKSHPDPNVSG